MASRIMKKAGRRKKVGVKSKTKTKTKTEGISLLGENKDIPDLFEELGIPNELLNLKYTDGNIIFNQQTKDLVYQFVTWYSSQPKEASTFIKSQKWSNFDNLYWSLPIFDSVRNWKVDEENKYFNSVDVQEGIFVCRKPGCNSRRIRYVGGSGTSGDEAMRAHYKCVVCNFPFRI